MLCQLQVMSMFPLETPTRKVYSLAVKVPSGLGSGGLGKPAVYCCSARRSCSQARSALRSSRGPFGRALPAA